MNMTAAQYIGRPLSLLALWEPHAILCVAPDPENGGQPPKVHETRHWFPYEQLPFQVAIHAAKKFDAENRDLFTAPRFKEALKRCGFYPGDPRPFTTRGMEAPGGLKPVPLGAIVGVATVVEVRSVATPSLHAIERGILPLRLESLSEDDRAFGYFVRHAEDPQPYRYAWRLAHTPMLPVPVPHSGRQEPLYPLDVGTLETIGELLRMAR